MTQISNKAQVFLQGYLTGMIVTLILVWLAK
jgi:hypothetical protein